MSTSGGDYGVNLIPLNADFVGCGLDLFSGQPPPQKTAKSLLHELYQQYGGTPDFDVEPMAEPPAEPCFRCKLSCPGFDTVTGIVAPLQTFVAEARSKKAAEHAAAKKAVDSFRALGLIPQESEAFARQQQQQQQQQQAEMMRVEPVPVYRNFCEGGYGGQGYAAQGTSGGKPVLNGGGMAQFRGLQVQAQASNGLDAAMAPQELNSITLPALREKYQQVVQENNRLKQALGTMLQIGQNTLEAS